MKRLLILISIFVAITAWSQDSKWELGLQVGGYLASDSAAVMYNGKDFSDPSIGYTRYGIGNILTNPNLKPEFDNYFQYPYSLAEYPSNLQYNPAVNVGVYAGYNIDESVRIYAEFNAAQIKVNDVFVVEIDNPNSTSVQNDLEQLPIIGLEQRLHINLGAEFTIYSEDGIQAYLPLFGSVQNTRIVENYILVNNKRYDIFHQFPGITNVRIGGLGMGAGTGLGGRYRLNEKYLVDLSYRLYYSRTRMLETYKPYGINHSLMLKIIWG